MRKKLFIIGGGILFVVIIALSIYLIRDSKPQTPVQNPGGAFPNSGEEDTQGVLPSQNDTTTSSSSEEPPIRLTSSSRLKPLTTRSVAGYIVYLDTHASSTILRYVESATGHIYEYLPTPKETTRISNTTIPSIAEALFSPTGEYVALRYLDKPDNKIKTFIAHVTGVATSTLPGNFLTDNASLIVTAPKERTAAERYILVEKSGVRATIDLLEFASTKRSRLLTLPTPEWHVGWPASGVLLLTSAPSGKSTGYSYLYDVAQGVNGQVRPEKILGPLYGLTAMADPTGSIIVYSYAEGTKIVTKELNTKTKADISLGISTFPEKCTVGRANPKMLYCAAPFFMTPANYPDAWYQGTVSFSDMIWKIDLSTGAGNIVVYPEKEIGQGLDAVNLSVDPEGKYLYFIDKNTGILWQLII